MLGSKADSLVFHTVSQPTWNREKLAYRTATPEGTESYLVDAEAGTRRKCDAADKECAVSAPARGGRGSVDAKSPDGKTVAFVQIGRAHV